MALFEQIGKRLTDAGSNVAQQTKDLAEVTKLNTAIAEREKKISQLLLQLGQSYYKKHRNDDTANEFGEIAKINALYVEILACKERIKEIKGVTKCENCGADVPLNSAFCNACGAKVNRIDNTQSRLREVCVCRNCQAVVEKGNLFCAQCGTKIDNESN